MERTKLNQSLVVARAAEMADAGGFDLVSLTAVAKSLGVQTPSLYTHVKDLAALRDGITVLALDELAERIGVALAGRSGLDALTGFATAHREYLREHPGRWESLQRTAGKDAVSAPAARRIVNVTDAVFYGYGITGDDRTHATRIVGGAISGFLNLERIGSFGHSSPDAEQSWHELIDALHFTLAHWHDRRRSPQKETP